MTGIYTHTTVSRVLYIYYYYINQYNSILYVGIYPNRPHSAVEFY